MSDETKAPLTVVEILDARIAENRKGLTVARERIAALQRAEHNIEGALIELACLRRQLGAPPAPKPEPPAPAPE